MKVPKSPYESIQGIVYFPRMLDKIRLHRAGGLREDLHENLGKGFDARCVRFLKVAYDDIAAQVAEGADDETVLAWCFETGWRPDAEAVEVWSTFMRKVGWKDGISERLAGRKAEGGWANRDDIETIFDYIDLDEGRPKRE